MAALKEKMNAKIIIILFISACFIIFEYYIGMVKPLNYLLSKPIHLYLAVALSFLWKPLASGKKGKPWMWVIDIVLILVSIATMVYMLANYERYLLRIPSVDIVYPLDIAAALITLVILMEAVRRTVGLSLFGFICAFLLYTLFGQNLPGLFRFAGTTIEQFSEMLILSTNGIMGTALGVSMEQIFFFVMFGAFFNACGGGQLLIDVGMYLGRKSVGGPAKAAVLSSSLMGTVSGSAVANVCATGVFTIPLMKRAGYTPEEAGAIETVASTGGQIMPPIMGVGAFIMAEMLGFTYTRVATAAIIPAVMYYLATFLVVHYITKRKIFLENSIVDFDYKIDPILPRLHLLVPMVSLVIFIFIGRSLAFSATMATVLVAGINLIEKKRRLNFREYIETAMDGVKQGVNIVIPTASCGIIIGIVVRSGVANKISMMMLQNGSEHLIIGLLFAAFGCLLLGMAMPTVAAYLIATVIFGRTLTSLGIEPLAAHMFIFYFGIIAQITPPVCNAAFAAAGISGGKVWGTGWKAFFMGLTAFLVPFVFVFKPEVLLIGAFSDTIIAALILVVGTVCLSFAVAGYAFIPLTHMWQRIIWGIISILIIMPETVSTAIGLSLAIAAGLCFYIFARKAKTATP